MMRAGHRQLQEELCSPVAQPNLCSEGGWIAALTKAIHHFVNTCGTAVDLILWLLT